jgi:hypothetical protein
MLYTLAVNTWGLLILWGYARIILRRWWHNSMPHFMLIEMRIVANMSSYFISSSLILVIRDNMIIGTNHIVLACLCRHF